MLKLAPSMCIVRVSWALCMGCQVVDMRGNFDEQELLFRLYSIAVMGAIRVP